MSRLTLRPLLCLLLLSAPAAAQTSPSTGTAAPLLTIPRVATAPTLEDYLDGTPRPNEAAVTSFVQREPGDGIPATQTTHAYVSYDDRHLFVIFVAREQEPGQVRASLTRREGFGNDDFVSVMLDTFGDRRRAYLFIVNPLGVQLDGVISDGDNDDDYSYDTVWDSDGRLTPFGFVVRIAIPFKSLRFRNTPTQEWGIALARGIRRNNETSFWPYITRRVASTTQQFAVARGVENISPGRNIQFIPYAAFAKARFLEEEVPRFVSDADGRGGIDSKFVVKDAFTVDFTVNPDFSQVESDEPQVTINQRFEVFFPEKRPFFIENASYFATPINLFFSRRIADPQAGLRVTGKTGPWAMAALAMDDRAPGQRVDFDDPARGRRTGVGVVRLQRELPKQSSLGLLATSRDFASTSDRVVALDGRYKISETWVVSAQAAMSDSTGADGRSRSGPAASILFDRTGRNWGAFFRYEDVSADFRAPLGFVRRVDTRTINPFARYTVFPGDGLVVNLRQELSGRMLWDHAGTLHDWEGSLQSQLELKGQTEFEFTYTEAMERFEGVEFRKRGVAFEADTAWLKWMEVSTRFARGGEINFFPGDTIGSFLATETAAEMSMILKPLPRLRLDQTYLFTRLGTRPGVPDVAAGAVIVDNHIWRSRASYQFTRQLSLRAIVDYSAVLPDRGLIALEREKRLTGDALITYLVNPWTALYAGYTDAYGNLTIDPISRDRLLATSAASHSIGRQVFVKLSYLLRL